MRRLLRLVAVHASRSQECRNVILTSTHSFKRVAALIVLAASVAAVASSTASARHVLALGTSAAVVVDPGGNARYPYLYGAYPDTLLRVSISGSRTPLWTEPNWASWTPDPSGFRVIPDLSGDTPDPDAFVPV